MQSKLAAFFIMVPVSALAVAPLSAEAQDAASDRAASRFAGAHVTLEAGLVDNDLRRDGVSIDAAGKHYVNFPAVRVAIGYDIAPANGIVLGVEAGLGTAARRTDERPIGKGRGFGAGQTYDATARLAFAPSQSLLLYGRGGYRWMRSEREDAGKAPGVATRKHTDGGMTYGAGIEYAMSRSVALRAEYMRTNFAKDLKQNRLSLGATLRF
ncbi:outer membrane protein [Sphingomonas sp. CJ20]